MKCLTLFLLCSVLISKLSAQTTFSGTITDSLRNPVPFASVYLNNTTSGAYTDNNGGYSLTITQEGAYELIVSCIGYISKSMIVKADNHNQTINLQLSVKPVDLKEVVVEEKSTNRLRDYSHFTMLIFGNSKFSKQCFIRNPNDLRLYGQFMGSIKRGYSVKPLEIINKALGYRIMFDLVDFSYDQPTQVIKFSGLQYYVPLKGSNHQQKKWEENRKTAYYGSSMHFLRKLYTDSAGHYNFGIYECPERNSNTGECLPGDPVAESQLTIKNEPDYKLLYFDRDINVVYTKMEGKKIRGKMTIVTTTAKSFVRFTDTVMLYRNGFYHHPYSIFLGGRMGDPRMAEMLPFDYMPEDYEQNSNASVQSSLADSIDARLTTPYLNYYSPAAEQVYTHFNKSQYLPGDEIWFKNYLFNPTTGYPCDSSRILYTELYAPDGKLLDSKILEIQGASAFNSFKLSDKALPGQYTFRAYTSWMKNFQSPTDFTTYLHVLGQSTEEYVPQQEYDIQFLPESGTLLAGTWNRVGVKALDKSGKGISLKGEILNSQKEVKTSFELNKFGMGEFRLLPRTDSSYFARVFLPDGKEQMLSLPKIEPKGVVVEVGDKFKDKIAVGIKINPQTAGDDEMFHILVHSQGNLKSPATVILSKDKPNLSFTLHNDEINNGVNYITVFNRNYEPVAEKAFFRLKENILGKISIEQKLVDDSVEFTVASSDSLDSPMLASLSMSVLPDGTVSDRFNTSLYCEALLKPGLSGYIENPAYYFESNDREHQRDLDLLFLTQGWRKYNWKEIAKDSAKKSHPFEASFGIAGNAIWKEKAPKTYVVTLMSPENNLLLLKNVNSDGSFMFPGLSLLDKTAVNISVSENTGKTKNLKVKASILPEYSPDSAILVKSFYKTPINHDSTISNVKLLPDEILLKDVVVTAKALKQQFEGMTYRPIFDKVFQITRENYFKYESIERLLMHEFNVIVRQESGNFEIEIPSRQNNGKVSLIIDDINYKDNYSMLPFMNPSMLEAVSVVKNGDAIIGPGGAIILKTRKEALTWDQENAANIKTIEARGFVKPVKYYTPRYLYPVDSEPYKKHATIFWKPDIITHHGKATFRFAVPKGVDGLKVRTEGFSENGMIFLDNRTIKSKNQ